jgi:coproporphyrinogen III oxidase-like Fe-S oxidoreductase
MYRHKQYTERPLADVFGDIDQAVKQMPDARRVFLADGDALALPTDHLLRILQYLEQRLENPARVSCYATPANILRKTDAELASLAQHKLKLVYLGIESGSDLILRKITKGASHRGIASAMHRAVDCGIKVSATLILGLGGQAFWQQHIDGSIELLNSAPLNYLSTLQLYLEPSAEAEFYRKFGDAFSAQNDMQILHELHRLMAGIEPPQPVIFRSNHASNALPLAGNLPQDRGRLLAQIEQAIDGQRRLVPPALRGL